MSKENITQGLSEQQKSVEQLKRLVTRMGLGGSLDVGAINKLQQGLNRIVIHKAMKEANNYHTTIYELNIYKDRSKGHYHMHSFSVALADSPLKKQFHEVSTESHLDAAQAFNLLRGRSVLSWRTAPGHYPHQLVWMQNEQGKVAANGETQTRLYPARITEGSLLDMARQYPVRVLNSYSFDQSLMNGDVVKVQLKDLKNSTAYAIASPAKGASHRLSFLDERLQSITLKRVKVDNTVKEADRIKRTNRRSYNRRKFRF